MTSAEATLIGIAAGALLTWLGSSTQAQLQWNREEKRRRNDLRAELYLSMLLEMDQLGRDLAKQAPPAQTDDEASKHKAAFRARVALFAPYDVRRSWMLWSELCAKDWRAMPADALKEFKGEVEKVSNRLSVQMQLEVNADLRAGVLRDFPLLRPAWSWRTRR